MQTKIRAWDGEMFYFVDLEKNLNPLNPDYEKLYNDYLSVFWQLETKEQSTGLIVGNGELFEGDIFKFSQHKAYNEDDFIAKIVFDSENASFGYIKKNDFIPNFIHQFSSTDELKYDLLDYIEIIGNIHENSDLLS